MVKIMDRDRGYLAMRRQLDLMRHSYTKVGIMAGSKESDGVTDLVTVAAANEFGTDRIPERSFLRATFDEQRETIAAICKAEADAIMVGKKTVETSLPLIGAYAAGQVQAKIHSHPPPPNAPATIERKGSSGTLVDSGQLAQSVRHVEIIQGREQ